MESLNSTTTRSIDEALNEISLAEATDESSPSHLASPRLRMTRVYNNGERIVDSIELRHLGDVHDRRPGRQIALTWESPPRKVLVVASPHSRTAIAALPAVVATLQTYQNLTVLVESEAMAEVAVRGGFANSPAFISRQDSDPSSPAVARLANKHCDSGTPHSNQSNSIQNSAPPQNATINDPSNPQAAIEKCAPKQPLVITRRDSDNESAGITDEVDLVICLGGDGLILHVVSQLFPRAVPPVMPFNNGSLGFLTPFDVRDHKAAIAKVLTDDNNLVAVRMRLQCIIVPKGRNFSVDNERSPRDHQSTSNLHASALENFASGPAHNCSRALNNVTCAKGRPQDQDNRGNPLSMESDAQLLEYHVLNEIVIDRGPAPYLSNLEVFADDCPVTRVQADGLIVATPTGSTAYSLSSGGSMVHPSVPAILFTPICPHSLSFRPVLFPRDVVLQIKVPEDARASAWVSFDGRHRMELYRGDRVVIRASQYPVPTFTRRDTTKDWFASVSQCLRWNERVQQSPLYVDDDRSASDITSPLTPSISRNEQGTSPGRTP